MQALEALREALAGWRKTKHPRFAAVAQWATARALAAEAPRPLVGVSGKKADVDAWLALLDEGDPLDLPRLFAVLGGGKSATAADRVVLLSKLNDPRVTDGLLALLAAPPYRAKTALQFFRACAKALADSGDPRVRGALEDLAARYKSIVETSVGDEVAALLRRTATSLDQVKPGPLPAAMEKKCAALEAAFDTERAQAERGATKQRSAQHGDDALLAAIYAAPDDDTPRLVFADALSERGDVRGEFIQLQLGRAKGQASAAQLTRERELTADPKRRVAWALPLSGGGECHVARGFPDRLLVEPRSLKTIVGNPALRTLHDVAGFERSVSVKQAKAFLEHEHTAHLRAVRGLTLELVEGLTRPLACAEAGLLFLPTAQQLARFPNLRSLSLGNGMRAGVPELTRQIFEGARALTHLRLGLQVMPPGAVLEPLTELNTLEALGWFEDFHWQRELGHLKKLKSLKLGVSPLAGQLEGLSLEKLECRFTPRFDAAAVLGVLPGLKELRVENSSTAEHVGLAKLLATSRLAQLRVVSSGPYEFQRPFTPQGVLEMRSWNRMNFERHAQALALLPEGCVTRVLVRPVSADPWSSAGPPPSDEAMKALTAATKVPVELAWY